MGGNGEQRTGGGHAPGDDNLIHKAVGRGHTVAVIGGGVAGLTCARVIQAAGAEVRVFDKGRAPGGRASTRRAFLPDGRVANWDHGCQAFWVDTHRFAALVRVWQAHDVVGTWMPRGFPSGDGGWLVPQPGMTALARCLASGIDIVPGVQVQMVDHGLQGWSLIDAGGQRLGEFDYVVAAVPPSQAAPLVQLAPALQAPIEASRMWPCWTLLAAFDSDVPVELDALLSPRPPLAWIARDTSKPGREAGLDCWVIHANPAWSRANIEASASDIAGAMFAELQGILGLTLPEPVAMTAHRWRHAFVEQVAPTDGRGCIYDSSAGIGACGDWTWPGHGFARSGIESAALAGLAMADALLETFAGTE